jgi:DNA (cytosine-5)-methyltransferase 1
VTLDARSADGPRRNQIASAVFQVVGHASYAEGIGTLRAEGGDVGPGSESLVVDEVAHTLRAEGFDASEDGTGRGVPLVVDDPNGGTVSTLLGSGAGAERPAGVASETDFLVIDEAGPIAFSSKDDGGDATEDASPTLRAMEFDKSHANAGGQIAVAYTTRDVSPTLTENYGKQQDSTDSNLGPNVVVEAYQCHGGSVGPMGTIRAGNGDVTGGVPFVPVDATDPDLLAFNVRQDPTHGPVADALGTKDRGHGISQRGSAVRRLTPIECERLQGFPDRWTAITYRKKAASDGPRYRALGNSMAVPVMAWLGQRIALVERLAPSKASHTAEEDPQAQAAT